MRRAETTVAAHPPTKAPTLATYELLKHLYKVTINHNTFLNIKTIIVLPAIMTAPPPVGSLFAIEIPITNLERSQKFYSELFGWQFAPNALPKGTENVKSLHFFSDASNSIKGALLLLEEGATPKAAGKEGWSVYPTFVVSDVGEAIEKAEGLGGGVKTPRTEIPNGMGVVGHVVDPDDNIIGLWSQK